MANVMSFHHTATLLRGGGYILLFTGILGNIPGIYSTNTGIWECSKSLVIDLIALYAKF